MTDHSASAVQDSYKAVLSVGNATTGISASLQKVQDLEGTESPLELSSSAVNIASGFQLGGVAVTSSAAEINQLDGVTLSGNNTGDQNVFTTIAVSGQSNVVADSASDTLTLVAGSNITITTNATTDTITIAASGGGASALDDLADVTITTPSDGQVLTYDSVSGGWKNEAVAGTGDVTAAASIADNRLVRGDGGSKGIQQSGITVDDSNNITGVASLTATGVTIGSVPAKKAGKETLWIPASAMTPAITSGATFNQYEAATNKQNYRVLEFDASADEYAHFQIALPKSWNEGTVTFQVFWSSSATDTDGVAWGLEAYAVSDNEAIDQTWGTAVVVTDDAQSAAAEVYVSAESSAVTIGGTPAAGDLVFFRFFRDVSDANDDMTEDARLHGIKLFYTTDAGDDT